ncbi:MAG: hypothetical protein JWN86_1770 [Planctomycetota bacterium]|nr:hypothetical protein [Planctomycetota bacterium]
MADIRQLHEQRNANLAEFEKLNGKEDFSDGDKARCAELERSIEGLSDQIKRSEKLEYYKGLSQRDGDKLAPRVSANADLVAHTAKHNYSLLKVVQRQLENRRLDGVEAEMSQELASRSGKAPQGIYVPMDSVRTNLNTTTGTGGIPTVTQATMIDILRAKQLGSRIGVEYISGAKNILKFPRDNTASSPGFSAEASKQSDSSLTLDSVTLTPHQIDASVTATRQFMYESSVPAEAWLVNKLTTELAVKMDYSLFSADGTSNSITGLLYNTDIPAGNAVPFGGVGGAPTWTSITSFEKLVDIGNALNGALNMVTTPKGVSALKNTVKVSGYPEYLMGSDGKVNGYNCYSSNQLPSNLTKSTGTALSAVLFGDFSQAVFVEFNELDILVDPFTASPNLVIRVYRDCDTAVWHGASFSRSVDLIAT